MHELSLMQNILASVNKAAEDAGALRVTEVRLSIGEMTEVVEDALQFAFEALSEGTLSEGARLDVKMIRPRSRCVACAHEFEHDRYHIGCPVCDSLATELIEGKELFIESIDVDLPDGEE